MASSILRAETHSSLRWISRNSVRWVKGAAAAAVSRFPNSRYGSKFGASVVNLDQSPSTLPSRISPWLMLPPAFEDGDMVYNFYSLAENKVKSIKKRANQELESPDDDAKLVGSSHGWLALFNKRDNDLFLSNPLSCRHIKLPPIDTLPNPEINLRKGCGSVTKVIISCSPDEEDCRAVMTFGPGDRLAFCLPGRSSEWTPIGDLFHKEEEPLVKYARMYKDFACSRRRNVFTCITQYDMEDWDLRDPQSARIDWTDAEEDKKLERDFGNRYPSEEYFDLLGRSRRFRYPVFGEQWDQLFIVLRCVMPLMGPDGRYVKYENGRKDADRYPYKTFDFYVFRVDRKGGKLRMLNGSLGGLAMFIGRNHSFAISAARFPELKPNSIYFTDPTELTPPDDDLSSTYGGHDIGIFDYENRTFSPCYYPCDVQRVKRIVPAPVWFTPSLH